MARKSFKEYSEAAMVEKEELQALKSCFEELHMLISMRGDISSSEVSQRSEVLKNFEAAKGITVKDITVFDENLRWYKFLIDIYFVFSLVFWKMFIKRAKI